MSEACTAGARRALEEHLTAVDEEMRQGGAGLSERRQVTDDLEVHIREVLAERARGTITEEDVLEVLSRLDPPSSYSCHRGGAVARIEDDRVDTPADRRTSGAAIAGLVFAILGLTLVPVLGTVAAILCGHIARRDLRRDPELGGWGVSTAALVIGYTTIGLIVLSLGFTFYAS